MKFKATVRCSETRQTVSWILRADSLDSALAQSQAKATQSFPDKHELDIEQIAGDTKWYFERAGALMVVLAAVVSIIGSSWLNCQTNKDRIKHEVMQQRQAALFDALRVVDHLYANQDFTERPQLKRSGWDIQEARDAMNKMLIYCARPETTVKTFLSAIGLGNPKYTMASVNPFRRQVAIELPAATAHHDSTVAWLYSLPGTTEDSLWKLTKHASAR